MGFTGAAPSRSPLEISRSIITAAMKVHTALGPGMLESAYEACLAHELRQLGLKLSKKSLGLIINFHVAHLKDGIKRFVEGKKWK